jgi:hypothetical protein
LKHTFRNLISIIFIATFLAFVVNVMFPESRCCQSKEISGILSSISLPNLLTGFIKSKCKFDLNFRLFSPAATRVARWLIFKKKIPIWANFLGSSNGRG